MMNDTLQGTMQGNEWMGGVRGCTALLQVQDTGA
jgi:hypothetical protein